ncbi:MAG TPA: UDP-N-acetylmuramate--L-alanine ligase [Patescibacteria group bacterium]
MLKNVGKIKSIHFVGIKGVGMAPLAVIAKEAGFEVTGCDVANGFITDVMLSDSGIKPFVGFDYMHIDNCDLVITTGAHGGFDNQEVLSAKERGIPVMTQGEAVGEFMKGDLFGRSQVGISVAGTHGKTTTSAMVATILKSAQMDPSWVIGTSQIPSLGVSGHFGQGKYFVAEADEYANEPTYDKTAKMLLQNPKIAIVTNIEHDHPDMYPTLEDVYKAFRIFVENLPKDGSLVTCGDDKNIKKILEYTHSKKITYGFLENNDYILLDSKMINGLQEITFKTPSNIVEKFSLGVSGQHNGLNALAAIIVGQEIGLGIGEIKKGLTSFKGTKRRLEYIGQLPNGALLYDDYAHHPTEIRKTLEALRQKYENKKIVCLFQPHTYSRTKLLLDQFIDSLSYADETAAVEIYPSAREIKDNSISSMHIVEGLKAKNKPAFFAKDLEDVVKYVSQANFGNDTVVITMGAGDIYSIANEILEHESAPSVS